MKALLTIFFLLAGSVGTARAESDDDLFLQTFRTIRYADLSRASIHSECRRSASWASPPVLVACKHIDSVPDPVIESAGLPFLKKYLSKEMAKNAIKFWSSGRARSLNDHLIREVKLGKQIPFGPGQLDLLTFEEKTDYGIAFRKFGADREQGIAVSLAVMRYVSTR